MTDAAAPQPTQQPSAPSSPMGGGLDTRKSIILGILGLAVIVLIFWKVIPQIGSYSDALSALQEMGWPSVLLVVLAVLLYLAVYGLPFKAATPGLGYWPSQQVNQAAFAISNGVPGGGAFGLAVQYGMLASYAVAPTAATASITVVGLWSIFLTLGIPITGVLALAASGNAGSAYLSTGLVGLGILLAAVLVLVLVMRSESLAARIGRLANAVVRPFGRWIPKLKGLDLVPSITRFRGDIHDVVARRWALITGAQVGVSLSQFLILYIALRGLEGWDSAGTSILVVFGAFAISQLGLMIPVTPGGLGTVDALMIKLLETFGVNAGNAVAADLVWRAASFVPQIIIGVIALVAWYRRAGRMLAKGQPA